MPVSADDIRSLHKYEIRILKGIERLMKRYQWVPEDKLREAADLSMSELNYRLGHLMAKNMVKSSTLPYQGYQLVFNGYDTLAVNALVKKGTVQALGCLLGVGKESAVYEALGVGVVVLKFHRIGQRSFQSVRLNRNYLPEWKHFPWIFASNESATREFEALKELHRGGVSVPVPVGINRNVVAMSFIAGVNLNQAVLENPDEVLDEILENMRIAYSLGYIHNDLSEFNVMVDNERVWIIDWPQWIDPSHENADEILKRDLYNIVNYFSKKYGISFTVEEALKRVVG
ncbi:serine/threonine protein phosphatase [Methanoplanus sp. FWC-SCC4]|uniref:non-specific serine/threonine protein kinase n=1 Tax=Methanochimaera problematica TaxID=2609417 RepID=A0AA97I3I6_9EURY|nr:RIO1 family regulatory kinase/ATPase [Methanoplanus sp. FWC-SCC4]WOF15256.1 serine/threonine protein phosphatase [Methanoplanus sp. FWC-SCC4]